MASCCYEECMFLIEFISISKTHMKVKDVRSCLEEKQYELKYSDRDCA